MKDPFQQRIIDSIHSLLVLACPGAGKTGTLLCRVANILANDPFAKIVMVTFTNKTADEIKDRLIGLVGKKLASRVIVGTFHSLALRQLKSIGLSPRIPSEAELLLSVKRAVQASGLEGMDEHDALQLIQYIQNRPGIAVKGEQTARLYENFQAILDSANSLDFTSILSRSVSLMASGKLSPLECNHLLVDEVQDVDQLQYFWLFQHLRTNPVAVLVGDPNQSIYEFRGSRGRELMDALARTFKIQTHFLMINYRSHEEILKPAIRLINHNSSPFETKIDSHLGPGGEVRLIAFKDKTTEAKELAELIENEVANGSSTYSDWAILGRNSYNLNLICQALQSLGIPYRTKSKKIWEEPPVCFYAALLEGIENLEEANFGFMLALLGVHQIDIEQVHNLFGDLGIRFVQNSSSDTLDIFDSYTRGNILTFAKFINECRYELKKDNIKNVIDLAQDFVSSHAPSTAFQGMKMNGLMDLLEQAKHTLLRLNGTLSNRIKYLSGNKSNGSKTPFLKGSVYVNTMHSAKGLEFKQVCLLQLDGDVIPSERSSVEEERRLMFVAMTRAMKKLILSYSGTPSRFLGEAGLL